jgi:hypothetical protein
VVVGADGEDDPADSGSAYVFDGATGAQLLKLRTADGAAYDRFGRSVAVRSDGALVVVGTHYDDDVGSATREQICRVIIANGSEQCSECALASHYSFLSPSPVHHQRSAALSRASGLSPQAAWLASFVVPLLSFSFSPSSPLLFRFLLVCCH